MYSAQKIAVPRQLAEDTAGSWHLHCNRLLIACASEEVMSSCSRLALSCLF